jgi:hypothetical protein
MSNFCGAGVQFQATWVFNVSDIFISFNDSLSAILKALSDALHDCFYISSVDIRMLVVCFIENLSAVLRLPFASQRFCEV